MALYCIIFEIKRDIGQNRDFFVSLHSTPPLEVPVRILRLVGKTRMVDLPGGGENVTIRLVVSIQYRRVTDGLTDR